MKSLSLCLFLTAMIPARAVSVWINEIHYDNAGTDTGEFIEIAGPAGTNLSAYSTLRFVWREGFSGGLGMDADYGPRTTGPRTSRLD